MDFVSINFRLKNYENESFQFLITKAPIEKRHFEIFIHGQLGHPAPEETYSDNSMKKFKKYMEEERIDAIKEKILESIESNDEFAEQKFDFLLLLS
ncbi:TPA: hypothetical protein ACLBZV_005558 [Bacillus cereus]|uniref:hypothetical protein n=1 Tax=Bacillus cereus TaxID=1396 RepID=UPI001F3E2F61|nr:hypothetical protein [Bacillus cereus]BCC15193.1 hypothetical protein BCM0074_p313 [Bacillus cereus]HDR6306420.1 hypothetical protein [Bacillus cereus]